MIKPIDLELKTEGEGFAKQTVGQENKVIKA